MIAFDPKYNSQTTTAIYRAPGNVIFDMVGQAKESENGQFVYLEAGNDGSHVVTVHQTIEGLRSIGNVTVEPPVGDIVVGTPATFTHTVDGSGDVPEDALAEVHQPIARVHER